MNRNLLTAMILALSIVGVSFNWLLGLYVQKHIEETLIANFKGRLSSEVSMLAEVVRNDLLFGNIRGVRNRLTKLAESDVYDGFVIRKGNEVVSKNNFPKGSHFEVTIPVYFSDEKTRKWGELSFYASTAEITDFSKSTSFFLLKWTIVGTLSLLCILSILFIYFWFSSRSLTLVLKKFLQEDTVGKVRKSLWLTWNPLLKALSSAGTKLKEQRERIAASEREALIGRTVSMISHDMKGPLAVFERVAYGDRARFDSEKQNMKNALNRILSMADSIKRADLESMVRPTMLDQFNVAGIAEISRAYAENHGTALTFTGIEVISDITLDPGKVARALTNLIHNACESTATEVLVSVKMETKNLIIRVSDNGAGVPQGDEDRIFTRGYTVGKDRGTGLGLAFVRHVALGHGGDVQYFREAGRSVFEVRFPNVIYTMSSESEAGRDEESGTGPVRTLVLTGSKSNLDQYRESLPAGIDISDFESSIDPGKYKYIFTENLEIVGSLEHWQQCIFLGEDVGIESNIRKIKMFSR